MSETLRSRNAVIYGLLAPGLIIFTICYIMPLFVAVYNSFFNWNDGPEKTFIGLQSYAGLIGDKVFWSTFMNNLTPIFRTMLSQIGIAFATAVLLQSKILKSKSLHRTVTSFPVVLSTVVMEFL